MSTVIIIVDRTKLEGTTWQEIGDYLAVVSLAQIDLDADPTAFDSILNLAVATETIFARRVTMCRPHVKRRLAARAQEMAVLVEDSIYDRVKG